MRSCVLITVIFATLPVPAHAGDTCNPGRAVSEVTAPPKGATTLSGPFSVEELEKANMSVNRKSGQTVPFGYSNMKWLDMKAAMQVGDQIYFVVHRDGIFRVEYYALVRNGCIIRTLLGLIT